MRRILWVAAFAVLLVSAFTYSPAMAQRGHRHGHMMGPRAAAGPIQWHGRVDDTVDIFVHGKHVTTQVVKGHGIGHQGWTVTQNLPHSAVHVYIANFQGRGQVHVFQQPNGSNGFTAGVRIVDAPGGSSDYHLTLNWR